MKHAERLEMNGKILSHGLKLKRIFPDSSGGPVELCKTLRRLERKIDKASEAYANGTMSHEEYGKKDKVALNNLKLILGPTNIKIFINSDCRGYALKIDSDQAVIEEENLERDWGGYGILAPDFTPNN